MKILIVGIDIGQSIAACFLTEKPQDPREYIYNADIIEYTRTSENLIALKAKIDSFKADKVVAICEPTGINYAKLWVNKLSDWGAEIRMVSNAVIPNYRAGLLGKKETKSTAKTDAIDAFSLACYYFDTQEPTGYLRVRNENINRIKEICLKIEHLNRLQNPIINRMRQELSWQCPEIARVKSIQHGEEPPLLWGWLAGLRKSAKYDHIVADTIGTGIEKPTRRAAHRYCLIEEEIFELRVELQKLIHLPEFKSYREIFTRFGFGWMLQGYLLGAIYPIEDFLKDNRPEVRIRKNRQTGGESKLRLSERRFMKACGMGVVRDDSGSKKKGKQSGSGLCRKALWQWCFVRLEVRKNVPTGLKFNYAGKLLSPAEDLKRRKAGGTPTKLARQRVIARVVRELFKELSKIPQHND
jgi:hypothetical protein